VNAERRRAIALVEDELERLREAGPSAVRALAASSPVDAHHDGLVLSTHVADEDDRLMVLVEAWRGRRTLATGGYVMLPDGTTHTPD
jgi:hypothetical protein